MNYVEGTECYVSQQQFLGQIAGSHAGHCLVGPAAPSSEPTTSEPTPFPSTSPTPRPTTLAPTAGADPIVDSGAPTSAVDPASAGIPTAPTTPAVGADGSDGRTSAPAGAGDGSQAGEAGAGDDGDDGNPAWVWVIVALLVCGAAAAGWTWYQRWSNQRVLNTLFQNGGAQSRSISVRPGRSATADDGDGTNGTSGGSGGASSTYTNPTYGSPTYAEPTYGTPSGGAVAPVYHVSVGGHDGVSGTGAGAPVYHVTGAGHTDDAAGAGAGGVAMLASPIYQIPMEAEQEQDGPGYLEVKAVTGQPMYRVLDPTGGTGSTRSARPVVAPAAQLYDVRDTTAAGPGDVFQPSTYGQIAPGLARLASTSGTMYHTLDPRTEQSSA